MSPRPAPPPEQRVTASDLVRHFGLWQERASRAPVYVLHRGRPRFVLATVETIDALCAPHDPDGAKGDFDAAVLLDVVKDLIVLADADFTITASSAAARAHFGPLAAGANVVMIAPPEMRGFLSDAIDRVVASGVGDRIDLPSPTRGGRMLALSIAPFGNGVALIAQDMTTEQDYRRAIATHEAMVAATGEVPGVATVRINPRGYVVDPAPALTLLTGLAREALAMIRFTALIEIGARVPVADTIEAVLNDGRPRGIDATLLVNRAGPLPIRIGLGAVRGGAGIEGVSGLIAAAPGSAGA